MYNSNIIYKSNIFQNDFVTSIHVEYSLSDDIQKHF